ncbi:NAD(P)-dependent oxidoreductase [Streptomyces sp. ATCC51928]|uniref:NAD(P)-dependent oxidoreductase n=1 Tax=Streptomyces caviscabies TaxID=90079 RepID=A0ABW2MK24_9ACTN|nr:MULTISPECIES: NAD(P)-dependent oxidoreductase [unclassified Streptomyces]MDX3500578.1 NAD(P)-dependent oxidoreductase [Streptomyces sp. ATCC51928]MDX5520639.1 NAD(P)-dependent oxidoreductase [Streptomyces sp. DE06-01C]
MTTTPLPAPDELARARLLVAPSLDGGLVRELERVAGRTAEPLADVPPPSGVPLLCVGETLPEALRTDRLLWFHSVNAGTDPLLSAGPWPAPALLTRTVGRMGERMAQYVLGWILAECQAVPEFTAQHDRAHWERLPTELIAGQTALIYGTGRIGTAVGRLLRACGVRTVGVARTTRSGPPPGAERGVVPGAAPVVPGPGPGVPGFDLVVGPGEDGGALAEARWVISTLPLTTATEGFFGAARFAAVRGATFVNVGRGATVDMGALEDALRDGRVRRAVLDVLPTEPAAPDDPVWRLPRTVITSHSSGITADEDVAVDFAACWEAVTAGRRPGLTVDVGRGY